MWILTCPEQNTLLQVPQFDRAVPASSSQRVFIRAKSQGKGIVCVGLPGQLQCLAPLTPHPHFSLLTACRPERPSAAAHYFPDRIEGFGENRIAQVGPHQRCILHLDSLQQGSPERKM